LGELAFPHHHHLATRLLIDSSSIASFSTVSTKMVELPSEVWTRIAFFACTDGGRMGAVLQQVSKLVAHGTAVHKNGVVMLLSAVQARLFYDYISLTEPVFQHVDSLLIGAVAIIEYSPLNELNLTRVPAILNLLPYLRSLTLFLSSQVSRHNVESSINSSTIVHLPHLESLNVHGQQYLPYFSVPKLATLLVVFGDLNLVVSLRAQAPFLKRITVVRSLPNVFFGFHIHIYAKFIAGGTPEHIPHGHAYRQAMVILDATPYLEPPVEHFTFVMRKNKPVSVPLDENEERFLTQLQDLARGRSTEIHSFQVLLQSTSEKDIADSDYLLWRKMFRKAVLEGNEMADMYAQEHLGHTTVEP
jgi:hypothetical protein